MKTLTVDLINGARPDGPWSTITITITETLTVQECGVALRLSATPQILLPAAAPSWQGQHHSQEHPECQRNHQIIRSARLTNLCSTMTIAAVAMALMPRAHRKRVRSGRRIEQKPAAIRGLQRVSRPVVACRGHVGLQL